MRRRGMDVGQSRRGRARSFGSRGGTQPCQCGTRRGADDLRSRQERHLALPQGFTALIEDLASRGLLDETLVVAIGEMGRTPKFNASGGRDHWGNVFSFVLAGAGIRPGQVLGASDRQGAYPARDRVLPSELTATILHLLGIGHEAAFSDRTGRPLRATEGEPLWTLLG